MRRRVDAEILVDLVFGRLTAEESLDVLEAVERDAELSHLLNLVIALKNYFSSDDLAPDGMPGSPVHRCLEALRRIRTVNTPAAEYWLVKRSAA